MNSFLVALVFGAGVAAWVWSQLARTSGNARPAQTAGAAAVAGLIAWFVFFSILRFILNIG